MRIPPRARAGSALLALALGLQSCAPGSPSPTPQGAEPAALESPDPVAFPVPVYGQGQTGVGNIYPQPGRPIPYSVGEDGEYIELIRSNIRAAAATGQPLSTLSHKMDRVMAVVDVQPGDVVADIGSGTGFLPLWLLERSVPFERVYAADHNALALEIMDYMLAQAGFPSDPRVVPIHTERSRVMLPPGTVDKAVILDLFFVLQGPRPAGAPPPIGNVGPEAGERAGEAELDKASWLAGIANALAPGGRLYVLETANQTKDRVDELPGFRRLSKQVDTQGGVFLRALVFEVEP